MTDLNTPLPELDANTTITLVGGLAIVGIGLVVVLQVPQARDACGRILRNTELQKVGREMAQTFVRGVAAARGWRIEQVPASFAG